MSLTKRRMGLLTSAPSNGFVAGTYSIYTVVNRNTIRSATINGVVYIPLREPIVVKSGDVLTIKLVSGEMPNVTGSLFLTTNKSLSPHMNIVTGRTPPLDGSLLTVTAASDISAYYFGFYMNSNSEVEQEYSVGLWHNGHRII